MKPIHIKHAEPVENLTRAMVAEKVEAIATLLDWLFVNQIEVSVDLLPLGLGYSISVRSTNPNDLGEWCGCEQCLAKEVMREKARAEVKTVQE